MSLGGPRHGARVWCLGWVPKHRNHWQELEDLLFSPQKLLVGAYFEILFLGCGFLIHLSNRSDSPRFRAPWKKVRQKYGTQQEPSLFKAHPLSCWYVCMILRFVKKLDFAFMSLGGPSLGARVWCLGRVPKHRNQWQEVQGLLFSPKKLSVGAYFEILFLGCGFLIHLSNRSPWYELVARSRGLVI